MGQEATLGVSARTVQAMAHGAFWAEEQRRRKRSPITKHGKENKTIFFDTKVLNKYDRIRWDTISTFEHNRKCNH